MIENQVNKELSSLLEYFEAKGIKFNAENITRIRSIMMDVEKYPSLSVADLEEALSQSDKQLTVCTIDSYDDDIKYSVAEIIGEVPHTEYKDLDGTKRVGNIYLIA